MFQFLYFTAGDNCRPTRLLDQHFGLAITPEDLLLPPCSPFTPINYYRPWRAHLQSMTQESGSTLTNDKEKFQICLDVQQFLPNEITVKTTDRQIVVEGRHDEREDEHGIIFRHFIRKYTLPSNCDGKDVTSSLSSDGVLIISAEKRYLDDEKQRVVLINKVGAIGQRAEITKSKEALQTSFKKDVNEALTETCDKKIKDSSCTRFDKDMQCPLSTRFNKDIIESLPTKNDHDIMETLSSRFDKDIQESLSSSFDKDIQETLSSRFNKDIQESLSSRFDKDIQESLSSTFNKDIQESLSSRFDEDIQESLSSKFDKDIKQTLSARVDKDFKDAISTSFKGTSKIEDIKSCTMKSDESVEVALGGKSFAIGLSESEVGSKKDVCLMEKKDFSSSLKSSCGTVTTEEEYESSEMSCQMKQSNQSSSNQFTSDTLATELKRAAENL